MLASRDLPEVRPVLSQGVPTARFIAETVLALLALSLVVAAAQVWLVSGGVGPGDVLRSWLGLVVECAAVCVILALPLFVLKKPAKPLGVCETLAVTRVAALALMLPLYAAMAIAVHSLDPAAGSYGAVLWMVAKLPTLYFLLALAGSACVTCGVMRLGCGGGAAAALVAVYAADTLSAKLGWG
jgi:hypothetical protein